MVRPAASTVPFQNGRTEVKRIPRVQCVFNEFIKTERSSVGAIGVIIIQHKQVSNKSYYTDEFSARSAHAYISRLRRPVRCRRRGNRSEMRDRNEA